ncbi:hypothetical protein SERLA73DRAFT_74717 [Serpula lacrymans var. lacrymans S7.3]|uniref:Uncharacterized protein n=2 Tax=Serpula lacrymans var. lacrymans TaxID=341189 RepID=F8Q043_SERL3|nr:uncharacterized protein SERLADRAFT_409242 [Serpula lacrymans var. lacrymans S7.9]EGN98515.1 hypothetical protein SERLA73DRAFT_74717 [Serpula lacrymans var. lacrymans S7.3]EGO24087.1 hypothetical protein SERLADRAFT_409242 [Serpula lacrymans var. lacrymans S7.9]
MPPQTIQAYPPSTKILFGNCDTVLIHTGMGGGISNLQVAQVCLIFQPVGSSAVWDAEVFLVFVYAESFEFAGLHRDTNGTILQEPDVQMFLLQRGYRPTNPSGKTVKAGGIYQLDAVFIPVDIIPVFRKVMDRRLNATNCHELPTTFYLNNFSDKETYNTFMSEF